MTKQFDLAEFEAFCRRKGDAEYLVMNPRNCPVTQFGRSLGLIQGRKNLYDSPALERLHERVWDDLFETPKTFSALASRLSRLREK
jgi:hypothetical protein